MIRSSDILQAGILIVDDQEAKAFSIGELLETVRVVLCATDSARAQLEPLPDWRSQPSADGLRR